MWLFWCIYCCKRKYYCYRTRWLKKNKAVAFKNNAPFINCISKINGIKIDNSEDLDVVMPMYNLLECSKNYKKTTGSLWNYYRDKPSDPHSSDSEPFKYTNNIAGMLIILMKNYRWWW